MRKLRIMGKMLLVFYYSGQEIPDGRFIVKTKKEKVEESDLLISTAFWEKQSLISLWLLSSQGEEWKKKRHLPKDGEIEFKLI